MKRFLMIKNIGRLVTMTDAGEGELGVITDATCVTKQGRIEWLGKSVDAPHFEEYQVQIIDADGGVVMPGLVDCHTHLVHGGSRELEVAQRARGVSYESIAGEGGGILSTVQATREASFEQLCGEAFQRADEALERGVTTIEVKSGYGLDLETELKMLRVVHWLNENHPIFFVPTFLGAHAIPANYRDNRSGYLDLIIKEMIPKVADEGLATFCDVFVENIAFTADEARKILTVAKQHGMAVKLHVDQLTSGGGAELAAEFKAVSADHLENISASGIKALAESGTIAVSIPGSTFYLGQQTYMPARKMIEAGISVAISTDYNPGTAPTLNLFLMATIAMSYNKMTIEETLKGITTHAAEALDLTDGHGVLREKGVADLLVLHVPNEYYPIYRYGSTFVNAVIKRGRVVFERK